MTDILAIVLGTMGGCIFICCCYCRNDLELPTYAITYTDSSTRTKTSEV